MGGAPIRRTPISRARGHSPLAAGLVLAAMAGYAPPVGAISCSSATRMI